MLKKYHNIKDVEINYLVNAVGEVINENKTPSPEHLQWYLNNCNLNDWLVYLVTKNGEYGILAVQEFLHQQSDDWTEGTELCSHTWFNKTEEEKLDFLKQLAITVQEETEFETYLGIESGYMARHEIGIWIPFNTLSETINSSFAKIKELPIHI